MTLETIENGSPLIRYTPDEAKIAELRERYTGLKADTSDGYEACRLALKELVPLRTGIEATRKTLKEESLAWGRKVDAAAKALTGKLLEIETPIQNEKKRVDDARESEARKLVEMEKARIAALEKAAKDAEEARLQVIRDAEQAKLNEERRQLAIERQRMEEDRKRVADEYAARLKAEREVREREDAERRAIQAKIDAERKRLDEETAEWQSQLRIAKERKEREEFERQAKQRAAEEAQAKWERECAEAEIERKAQEEEARRLAEAKPDEEKVRALAERIIALATSLPSCRTPDANKFLNGIQVTLDGVAKRCADYHVVVRQVKK